MLKLLGIRSFDPALDPCAKDPPPFSKSRFTLTSSEPPPPPPDSTSRNFPQQMSPFLLRNGGNGTPGKSAPLALLQHTPPVRPFPLQHPFNEMNLQQPADPDRPAVLSNRATTELSQRILSILGETKEDRGGVSNQLGLSSSVNGTASAAAAHSALNGAIVGQGKGISSSSAKECFKCFLKRTAEEEAPPFSQKHSASANTTMTTTTPKHFKSTHLSDWTIPLSQSLETDVAFTINAANPSGLYLVEALRASIAPPPLKTEILDRWNKESLLRKLKIGFSGSDEKDDKESVKYAILEGPLPSPPSWMPVHKFCFDNLAIPPPSTPFSLSRLSSMITGTTAAEQADSAAVAASPKGPPLFIRYIEGFMTKAEVDWLVAFCKKTKVPGNSTVVSDKAPAGKEHNARFRKSETFWLGKAENPMVYRIESRACALVGLPLSHLEALQVVHYKGPGDFFSDHFDALTNESTFANFERTRNQRIVSIFVYLSDPVECDCRPKIQRDANGVPLPGTCSVPPCASTSFRHIKTAFKEPKGNAILWASSNPDGLIPEATLHSGVALCEKSGEKWGLNVWMRSVQI